MKSSIVLHKEHCSKILGVILGMKTDYWSKHNTKLMNPKNLADKWIYLLGFYIHAFNFIIIMVVLYFLCLSWLNDDYSLLNILCNYYDYYASYTYIRFLIEK